MLPGENLPVDGTEEANIPTKGSASLKSAQEILSACDPISGGNTIPADLISVQPQSVAQVSQAATGFKKPQCDVHKSTCPRCGLKVSDNSLLPLCPSHSRLQGSSLSVHSSSSKRSKRSRRSRRSSGSVAGSNQPAATPGDLCFRLLLACLSCQISVVLAGLLEACSCCLQACCSACCSACAHCYSAIRDVPADELNCHVHCHSVGSTECLEFCLECCELCHRS